MGTTIGIRRRDDLIGLTGDECVAAVNEYCAQWSSPDAVIRDNPDLDGRLRSEAKKVPWRTPAELTRALAKKTCQFRFLLPTKINIEVASVCPLRCEYCVLADLAKHRRAPKLSADAYRRIWRSMEAYITEVEFTGGEPLMNDDVYAIMAETGGTRIHTTLTTNAQLLTDERIDRVLDAAPTRLLIAYDSGDAESYETTRRRGKLSELQANIVRLVERRRARGIRGAQVHLQMVVHKKNEHEVEQFWRDAEAMGADAACIKPVLVWPGEGEAYERRMIDEYLIPGHPMSYHALDENGKLLKWRRPGFCSNTQHVHVGSGSEVIPCWYRLKDTWIAGYAADTPFPEIWHSPAYIEYRRRMLDETVSEACRGCIGNTSSPTTKHLWTARRFNKEAVWW